MAQRRKNTEEEPESHERWLVSYADFITLLFAFFVVMYAISSVNEGKYRVLSSSLGAAFTGDTAGALRGVPVAPAAPVVPDVRDNPARAPHLPPLRKNRQQPTEAAIRREREQMTGLARDLQQVLAPLVSQGTVRVTQTARGVSVEISASVLFDSGDATLRPRSVQALTAVAQVLKDDIHALRVEGHADDVPVSSPQFPSNWELSAVRASSVVRLLGANGVAESRLEAVGHGSNQPVASNQTPEGRLRNRRVMLMILSALPESVTEVPIAVAGSPAPAPVNPPQPLGTRGLQ